MDRDETGHLADGERFQAGPEEVLGGRPSRRAPRWWLWLVPAAAAALVIALVTQRGKPAAAPASRAPTASARAPSPAVIPFALSELLDETGGWELFGRGPDSVVRLQIAENRITRTTGVGLGSGGPVSFVVGSNEAVIRPLDDVPGYAIPDGKPPRKLTGELGAGGLVLPGPHPDDVWLQTGEASHASMTLVGLDSRRSDTSISIPAGFSPYPVADGAGYLLLAKTDGRGVYDARPGMRLRRVTTGDVLAIGPTRWLVRECASTHRCTTATVEWVSGARHVLHDIDAYQYGTAGLISPDGATAAMTDPITGAVHLVTLADGVDRPVDVSADTRSADGAIVWEPDSRWLFVADRYGDLAAVERRTGQVRHFGTVLPELRQLAVRPLQR
ncbi:MAG TPA: hypothetical protein VEK09_04705 [Jatrophihabitantaceae bacterium]|nr:hypothetical protein [Jatrophihabitantaceae bacterium]